ncbi:hypothetical protein QAD02_022390 [Eretmocerus hayati]|uniref:Uncharacterized protein n=1 Tax=Eretmocerus hayati TaxID=131215 RepID=A0ACC2PUH9_9HYME|nr:hypothetical protein QAD02_022390 [Eretmocerus hayati]
MDLHVMGEQESRAGVSNGLLDMIFKFFLDILQVTFGQIPPLLRDGVIKNLTYMVEGKAKSNKITYGSERILEETHEGGCLPTDAPRIDTEGTVVVPKSLCTGKPTAAAYYVYQEGHEVELVSRSKPRFPNMSHLRNVCTRYLRRGLWGEKGRFKKNLLGRFCMNVYTISMKH